MENKTSSLFQQIQESIDKGERRSLTPLLRELKDNRYYHFTNSLAQHLEKEFSDAVLKILLLELDEDEDESIELAELAYIASSEHLNEIDSLRIRVLLLHYFYDYFTDAIITIFLDKYRADELLKARALAIESIDKLQIVDLLQIELQDNEFINRDSQLFDAANEIECDQNLSEKELLEATTMHRVIHAYLKTKYKKHHQ